MRKQKEVTIQCYETVAMVCDVCDTEYEDELEQGEFISLMHICGYNSVFGDGSVASIDICQYCVRSKLGQFIRVQRREDYELLHKRTGAIE